MIMFLIPIAQPPRSTNTIDRKGRIQCFRKSMMKASEKRGIIVALYAPLIGNQSRTTPRKNAKTPPSQKYGDEVKK